MKRAVASIGIGLLSLGFLGAFACVANAADIKERSHYLIAFRSDAATHPDKGDKRVYDIQKQ